MRHASPQLWPPDEGGRTTRRAGSRGLLGASILAAAVAAAALVFYYRDWLNPTAPMIAPEKALEGMVGDAFPGAEGFGRISRGGRGGRIIAVTNLDDSGRGSLRACIEEKGPRVCVFRVGGVIRYTTLRPIIRNPYLTIAGETAPGGGILITHQGGEGAFTPFVIKGTHDIVVRHIRVRLDRLGQQRRANSAFIIEKSSNVILDHVSSSWAQDENFGGHAQNDNITVSWSIFAEGVPRHDKCGLLSDDPTAPQRISFIRNLCAHNGDRNPDVNVMPGSCVEVINNVMYNASLQFTEIWGSFGGTPVNIIGNYYRRGPNTSRLAFAIDHPLVASRGPARIYQTDNIFDGKGLVISPAAEKALVDSPTCDLVTKPISPRQAYSMVLAQAGALPRDQIDARIVEEVMTRTGRIGRENRNLPPIANGSPYADQDADGMSDAWERTNGTDPRVSDAWSDADGDGWTNLDEFLDYAHRSRLAGLEPR